MYKKVWQHRKPGVLRTGSTARSRQQTGAPILRYERRATRRTNVWILLTSLLWAAACTSPAGDAPPGPRFVVLGAAVVRDGRTGLERTRHDDGVGLDWYKAGAYCQALMIDDAGRWRLPGIGVAAA